MDVSIDILFLFFRFTGDDVFCFIFLLLKIYIFTVQF